MASVDTLVQCTQASPELQSRDQVKLLSKIAGEHTVLSPKHIRMGGQTKPTQTPVVLLGQNGKKSHVWQLDQWQASFFGWPQEAAVSL